MPQLCQLECHVDGHDAAALRDALVAVFGASPALDELVAEALTSRRIQDGVAAGAPWAVPGGPRKLRVRPAVYRWDERATAQLDLVIEAHTVQIEGVYRPRVGPALWTLARRLAALPQTVLVALTDEASEGAPAEWRDGDLACAWEFDLLAVGRPEEDWPGDPPDGFATHRSGPVAAWARRAAWRPLPWVADL